MESVSEQTTTKKRKRIVIILLGLAVISNVIWFGFHGIRRCYYYHQLFGSQPKKIAQLSAEVIEIQLPKARISTGISLGYAKTSIEPTATQLIKFIEHLDCVVLESNSVSTIFEQPWDTSKSSDPLPSDPRIPPPLIEFRWRPLPSNELFRHNLDAARIKPKGYIELFIMSNRRFSNYMELAITKTMMPYTQQGIGVFETEHVKGLICLGHHETPGILYADVYAKQSNVMQSITVKSDSAETSKHTLFSLLTSYEFVISEIPETDKLRQLIKSNLEKYETFEIVFHTD